MKKKQKNNQEKKLFAANWGFTQIFMFFLIGCIIGVYYEQILNLIANGVWESRQGLIYGPFNPVYGAGFALFVLFLGKNIKKRKWYLTYIYACLLGGAAEYITCWISEVFFDARSWDYSHLFLNIQGRTTIPFMLFWGLGGLIFMLWVYPFIVKLLTKIPYKFGRILLPILVTFMALNMLISYSALIRQANRLNDLPPANAFSRFLDRHYTDEFLAKYFTNWTRDN